MLDEGCGCPGTGTGPIAGAVPYGAIGIIPAD